MAYNKLAQTLNFQYSEVKYLTFTTVNNTYSGQLTITLPINSVTMVDIRATAILTGDPTQAFVCTAYGGVNRAGGGAIITGGGVIGLDQNIREGFTNNPDFRMVASGNDGVLEFRSGAVQTVRWVVEIWFTKNV